MDTRRGREVYVLGTRQSGLRPLHVWPRVPTWTLMRDDAADPQHAQNFRDVGSG